MAIAPGTAIATAVTLTMRGRIKLGRWLPFRAKQVLNPYEGFIWAARVAGLIVGSDRYLDGIGEMHWKLAGLLPVANEVGPDVSKSAAGRAGAEAVWIPTALLPRSGAIWSADDDGRHICVRHTLDVTPIEVEYAVKPDGRIESLVFDRWGDPARSGTFGWHRFGGEITRYRTFDGLSIPSSGRLGWHYGTDQWPAGEFFHYEVTSLRRLVRRA
jgi:hypothetical protein